MGWSRCYKSHVFEDPKDGAVLGSHPSKGQYPVTFDAMGLCFLDYYYIMDDRDGPLALLLQNVGDVCYYTHDLAEQWIHKITVEEILRGCDDGTVALLDGSGACPPEDGTGLESRGCLGYNEFMRAFNKNPRKPKVREALREMRTAHNYNTSSGTPSINFDPLRFDVNLHRHILDAAIAGPSLRKKDQCSIKLEELTIGCASRGNRLKGLKKCLKCLKVSYCSRECQLRDWKEGGHKNVCKKKAG